MKLCNFIYYYHPLNHIIQKRNNSITTTENSNIFSLKIILQ